jgi:hypothetical protein
VFYFISPNNPAVCTPAAGVDFWGEKLKSDDFRVEKLNIFVTWDLKMEQLSFFSAVAQANGLMPQAPFNAAENAPATTDDADGSET